MTWTTSHEVCQISAAVHTHILAVPAVVLVLGLDVDGELGQEGALQGTAVSWAPGTSVLRDPTPRDAHPEGHPLPRMPIPKRGSVQGH